MRIVFSALFCLKLFAGTPIADFDELDHMIKGCPINSNCSELPGKERLNWLNLLRSLQDKDVRTKNLHLKSFVATHGLYINFFSTNFLQTDLQLILNSSNCQHHKDTHLAGAFLKSFAKNKLSFIQNEKNFTFAYGQEIFLRPVHILKKGKVLNYSLPIYEQPLYHSSKGITYLKDEEGIFFYVTIPQEGTPSIRSFDHQDEKWLNQEEVECPKELKENADQKVFKSSFCKTIYDLDEQRTVFMRIGHSC